MGDGLKTHIWAISKDARKPRELQITPAIPKPVTG